MELREINGLRFYQFPGLGRHPEVIHGLFTRVGGISQGPYFSLNVSQAVGDDPERVAENRRRIQAVLGLEALVEGSQIHGGLEAVIGEGPLPSAGEIPEVDILLTDRPGIGLMIKQADCQAVLFYDPEHRVVANTHCGWRGQISGVLPRTVELLRRHFGSRPECLHAAVGPGLGPCCAEFRHFRREFPPEFWRYQVRPGYFDLWQLSVDQLRNAGLRPENLEAARLCTRCRAEEFFSYRRERLTGRQGAVIALRGP